MIKTLTIQPPQPKQEEFLRAKAMYVAYGGARGGGKSWALRTKLVLTCFRYPGYRALILRRTYKELLENHIDVLRRELRGICKYNGTDKKLTFPNESTIEFGYCNHESDVNRYQGIEYDAIAMDEGTHFTEYMFRTVAASIRGTTEYPRRMYITCNPGDIGHAWVKRLFIDRQYKDNEDPDDYVFIPAKVTDNAVLMRSNPKYISWLDNLPDGIREAWRDGDWDVFTGQFFTEWNRDIHVVEPFEIPKDWKLYITIDYGMDMLAAYLIAVDEDGTGWVTDEVYEGRDNGEGHNGLIISEAAERLKKMADKRRITSWLAPPDLWSTRQETGRSAANIFSEHGINLTKTSNDRLDGWYAVRERLKVRPDIEGNPTAGLKIFRGCSNLIRTLPQLLYNPKKPSDASTEPHEITHAPDAIRGFCVYWTKKPKRKKSESSLEWTEDMWEDWRNSNSTIRELLREKWGNPPTR